MNDDTGMKYYARVKLWRRFFFETAIDIGAYLSDVPYHQMTDKRQSEIMTVARRCGNWPIVPVQKTQYVGNTKEVVGHYWVLRDRNRL